jgi:PAS domain S-box-containing protein
MLEASHSYVLLLMLATVVNAVCAGGLLLVAPDRVPNRLAAALLGAPAFWALCAVAWNVAPDPESALFWMHISTPGWIFAGPIVLHIVLALVPRRRPVLDRLKVALYAVSVTGLAVGWTTDALIAEALPTAWGYTYRFGPAYPLFIFFNMLGIVPGVYIAISAYRRIGTQIKRRQRPFAVIGVLTPVVVTTVTDIALPMLGVEVLQLGTTSFAVLGAIGAANLIWYGQSFLSPGSFADDILETLSDGVAMLSRSNRIQLANPAMARISGYSQEELAGMDMQRMLADPLSSTPTEPGVGEPASVFESYVIRRDGERIPISVATSELFNRRGLPIGRVAVVRDLREVYELRRRLITSARLVAVGELAAGIAHEINNPIAYVRSNLTQLQDHWKYARGQIEGDELEAKLTETFDEAEELLFESLEGVDRAAEIVRGVMGFAHTGPSTRKSADVNGLLEDVLRMAAPQLRDGITIEPDLKDLPSVSCSSQELKQVFLNLVLNAGQAFENDGKIRITTEYVEDHVVVRVEDDGPGIASEILDRIFDPFFTTKTVGEGTGLGLGIAHQIIHAHGGVISVTSEPGAGAAFTVRLPIATENTDC